MSDGDEVGKIFVGGLTRETSDEMLREYFSKYGDIVECIVMRDKMSGVSRGFGFVKYSDQLSVQEVLKSRPHTLDNKKIDPKPCTPKTIQQQKKNAAIEHTQTHKIFIGGLAQNATEDEVRNYFINYGKVTEVVFVINKEENRHKGFGFVTFEEESSVDQAVGKHFHEICGKRVEAKRATPREKMRDRNQGADGSEGYGGSYGYGYQGPNSGGWMAPGSNGGMMGGFGYPPYGQGGYGANFPYGQAAAAGYYGYNYNAAGPGMMYGQGGTPNKGDASGYGGMGNYQQQTQGGYGPTRGSGGQSYSDYGNGNGYGRGGESAGGGRGSGQSYHPYKR